MKIYIDNVLIHFNENLSNEDYIKIGQEELFRRFSRLESNTYLIQDFDKDEFLERIVDLLTNRPEYFIEILIPDRIDYSPYKEIEKKYDSEPAAGGLVKKEEDFLMIRRLGKWDLPKGKIEEGENKEEAAIREVAEECCVIVNSLGPICETYHMYMRKGKPYIKRTSWFLMECLDDSKMSGQEEEGITDVSWFNQKMLETNLIHSYANIEDVFINYLKMEHQRL